MSWMRYIFDPNEQQGSRVKTHVVHGTLAEAILAEYVAQGERLMTGRGIFQGAEAISQAGVDMGGPCFTDRPWEMFELEDLMFHVPSGEVDLFHKDWLRARERTVAAPTPFDAARRLPYFKLKGSHCLVLPPALYEKLMAEMQTRIHVAAVHEAEFMALKGQTPRDVIQEANAIMRTKPAPFAPLPRRPKPIPQG